MFILIKLEKVFLRKNIVAVLRSRTFSLKVNKLHIFSEITQVLKLAFIRSDEFT